MTLRVTMEVVPRGDESKKFKICMVEVSQVVDQNRSDDIRDYDYEIIEYNQMIPEGQAGRALRIGRGQVFGHNRTTTVLELIRRILESHCLGT